jgi:excinuclease ABC subunit B
MERALAETGRRREKQVEYNQLHGITPESVKRNVADILAHVSSRDGVTVDTGEDDIPHMVGHNLRAYIGELEEKMRKAAADLEFEEAARLRDQIRRLEEDELGMHESDRIAPRPVGNSNQGRPGTRRNGFGKTQRKWGGKR